MNRQLPARLLVGAAMLAAAVLGEAPAAAAADFYSGKTLHVYIGFGPGGGYDLYGRLFARYFGQHIAGHPTIIAENMPGAGGLKAAMFMDALAQKDGTDLAEAPSELALDQLIGGKSFALDAAGFNWIGRLAGAETLYFTWHTSATKTFADLMQRETPFGSSGSGTTYYVPKALNHLAGTKIKLVTGYHDSTSVLLAVERGEVDGGYGLWSDLRVRKADWFRDKTVNPIVVLAKNRLDGLPSTPTLMEVAQTAEGRKMLELLTLGELGRAFFTAPGVPAERVAELRQAFADMLKDPEFQAEAEKSGLVIEAMSGEELHNDVVKVVHASESIVKELTAVIE
jgi:tripartite-type tricarboxylate transporter receptor subunit TctC